MTYTLIAEELGFGNGGLAMNIIGSLMGPVTVMLAGDESQKGHYITPFSDELEGYMRFGSLAFAERTGGYSLADIGATARREGAHYLLNGSKRDVIHGGRARPRVALVRLEGAAADWMVCAPLRYRRRYMGCMCAPMCKNWGWQPPPVHPSPLIPPKLPPATCSADFIPGVNTKSGLHLGRTGALAPVSPDPCSGARLVRR